MRKILIVMLMLALVGCSKSWSMTQDDETKLNTALQEMVHSKQISLSVTIQEDLKPKNTDGSEMILTTNYIAYRIHEKVSDLQYQADQNIAHVIDFQRTDQSLLEVVNNKQFTRLSNDPVSVTLDDSTTMDDLNGLGVELLSLNESVKYNNVTVKTNGSDLIYDVNIDAEVYEPFIDLKDYFVLDSDRTHEISEYTIVINNNRVEYITLIYTSSNASHVSITNVTLQVHGMDDVLIPFIDVD